MNETVRWLQVEGKFEIDKYFGGTVFKQTGEHYETGIILGFVVKHESLTYAIIKTLDNNYVEVRLDELERIQK